MRGGRCALCDESAFRPWLASDGTVAPEPQTSGLRGRGCAANPLTHEDIPFFRYGITHGTDAALGDSDAEAASADDDARECVDRSCRPRLRPSPSAVLPAAPIGT